MWDQPIQASFFCLLLQNHSVCTVSSKMQVDLSYHVKTKHHQKLLLQLSKVLWNLMCAVTPWYLELNYMGQTLCSWGPILACSWGIWLSQHFQLILWDQDAAVCSAVTRQPALMLCSHMHLLLLSLNSVRLCPTFALWSLFNAITASVPSVVSGFCVRKKNLTFIFLFVASGFNKHICFDCLFTYIWLMIKATLVLYSLFIVDCLSFKQRNCKNLGNFKSHLLHKNIYHIYYLFKV